MPVQYDIYRVDDAHPDFPDTHILIFLGSWGGNNARQALTHWYAATGEVENHDFFVIPVAHIHPLSPTVERQTRLGFSS